MAAGRRRRRHDDAEPGAGGAEPRRAAGPRRGQLGHRLLPLPRRRDRRLRAGRAARQPGQHHLKDGLAARRASTPGHAARRQRHPEPVRPPRADPHASCRARTGHGIADVFLVAAPFALLAFLVALFLKERVLRGRGEAPERRDRGRARAALERPRGPPGAPRPARARHRCGNPTPVNGSATNGVARRAAEVTTELPATPEPQPLQVSGVVRQNAVRALPGAQVTLADQSGRQVGRDGQRRRRVATCCR